MSTRIAISQFKSHCSEILEELQVTHQSIVITKNDKPIAEVVPLKKSTKGSVKSMLAAFKYKGRITGDILAPLEEGWDKP